MLFVGKTEKSYSGLSVPVVAAVVVATVVVNVIVVVVVVVFVRRSHRRLVKTFQEFNYMIFVNIDEFSVNSFVWSVNFHEYNGVTCRLI